MLEIISSSYILRRPQTFAKSPSVICHMYCQSNNFVAFSEYMNFTRIRSPRSYITFKLCYLLISRKDKNSQEICMELNRNPNLFSLKFYKCASIISDIRELLFSCPFLSICVYGILYKNWYHILVSSSAPYVCIIMYWGILWAWPQYIY